MEECDSVDLVRSDYAQVGHSYLFGRGFLHQRKGTKFIAISGVFLADLVQPIVVDEVDKFQVSGKELTDKIDTPFLQCFWQNCMIGI